jgi:DNA-binding NarL/FixJ family response regulator
VIAMSSRPEARGAALAAGVDQFVSKSAPPEQVISTLQAVNDHQPPRPKAT